MPYKSKEKEKEHNQLYYLKHKQRIREQHQQYDLTHREEKAEYQRRYGLAHMQEKRRYNQQYSLVHKEERKQYRLTHRREIREYERQVRRELGCRFMDGIYGHVCLFCKGEVSIEELARHHINGDGSEERAHLGGEGVGTIRSWRKAIAEQDTTKWATVHLNCHTAFHNHLKVKKSHEP